MRYFVGIVLIALVCGCSQDMEKEPKEVRAATEDVEEEVPLEKSDFEIENDTEQNDRENESKFLKGHIDASRKLEDLMSDLTSQLILEDVGSSSWNLDTTLLTNQIDYNRISFSLQSHLLKDEQKEKYSDTIANVEVIEFRLKTLVPSLNEALDTYDKKALEGILTDSVPPLKKLAHETLVSIEKERYK